MRLTIVTTSFDASIKHAKMQHAKLEKHMKFNKRCECNGYDESSVKSIFSNGRTHFHLNNSIYWLRICIHVQTFIDWLQFQRAYMFVELYSDSYLND